ncbi:hypothetical protein ZHAS_00002878 [Anopheles sinensis]|uniref:Uncharacterized protein n=1 Tax=Anopheles sinensis TaxID=74873 RepID=A0A084VD79_ANOSI|nr:hypothetical protein ZHAS_00002878 [Anopheles sinensis]
MVNLVERPTTTTTTTTTTETETTNETITPTAGGTDVSRLQPWFPSTVPTAAGSAIAENRFPLFLEQAGSSAPDSDDEIGASAEGGQRVEKFANVATPFAGGFRASSCNDTVTLNGVAGRKVYLNELSKSWREEVTAGDHSCHSEPNGIDHDHEMTSTVAAVTSAANKAVAALMQYRQQQQQQQQSQPTASANGNKMDWLPGLGWNVV